MGHAGGAVGFLEQEDKVAGFAQMAQQSGCEGGKRDPGNTDTRQQQGLHNKEKTQPERTAPNQPASGGKERRVIPPPFYPYLEGSHSQKEGEKPVQADGTNPGQLNHIFKMLPKGNQGTQLVHAKDGQDKAGPGKFGVEPLEEGKEDEQLDQKPYVVAPRPRPAGKEHGGHLPNPEEPPRVSVEEGIVPGIQVVPGDKEAVVENLKPVQNGVGNQNLSQPPGKEGAVIVQRPVHLPAVSRHGPKESAADKEGPHRFVMGGNYIQKMIDLGIGNRMKQNHQTGSAQLEKVQPP